LNRWMSVVVVCCLASSSAGAFDFFGLFGSDSKEEAAAENQGPGAIGDPTKPDEEKVSAIEEDSPIEQTEVAGGKSLTGHRAFRPPDYSGQDGALGYSAEAFKVPKGLEKQVNFWIDIYSKYTTHQGVIHDTENLDIVYEEVDFKDIENDDTLTRGQKEKRKRKFVEQKKKDIAETLQKLSKVSSPDGLTDFEKKIWKLFASVDEENKFKEAAQKSRLRFQLGQKDRMQSAIFFSGRYLESMEQIFKQANMPMELTRIVFVESSFNVLARSKVGASGLWQIMRRTARPYHYVTSNTDLRNQPMAATKLATRLLEDNFRLLKDWSLAVTGWNHGPTGVRKMTEKYNTRELVNLIENVRSRRSFGFASRNFYACFLAALEVERNATKYFPKITWSEPLDAEDIKLPIAIKYKDFLTWFDGNDERAQVFNPHINRPTRRLSVTVPAKTVVSLPKDRYSQALISLAHGESRYVPGSGPELKAADGPSEPILLDK
jgi:membrane-bound lytic murein transglycosylase D